MVLDDDLTPYNSEPESDQSDVEDAETLSNADPTFPEAADAVDLSDEEDNVSDLDELTDDEEEPENEEADAGPQQTGGTVNAPTPDEETDTEDDDDDDDDDDEEALKKFDSETKNEYLADVHPESKLPSYEEVRALCKIVRDDSGRPCDPLHRTQPILSKYERARVIGLRATQLADGATPLVEIKRPAISELVIAEMELEANKLPFIIRRPLITGGSEYWKLSDLEQIN